MLSQNVVRHGVAVSGHDAGDDQQQGPQQNIHGSEQTGYGQCFPVVKISKQGFKGRLLTTGEIQIESGVSNADYAAQNEIENGQNQRSQNEIDCAAHEKCPQAGGDPIPPRVDILPRVLEICAQIPAAVAEIDLRPIGESPAQKHCHHACQNSQNPFAAERLAGLPPEICCVFHETSFPPFRADPQIAVICHVTILYDAFQPGFVSGF